MIDEAEPVLESAAEPVLQPRAESALPPRAEQVVERVPESVIERVGESVAELVAEPAPQTERGSGTVLMVVAIAMTGFLITVILVLASAIVARHRAGAIADLSALAAAGGSPGPQACARARRVARANAGRLISCQILGDGSALVQVELLGSGLPIPARGTARAGQAPGK